MDFVKVRFDKIHDFFIEFKNNKKYLNWRRIITFQFYIVLVICYSESSFHEMHFKKISCIHREISKDKTNFEEDC